MSKFDKKDDILSAEKVDEIIEEKNVKKSEVEPEKNEIKSKIKKKSACDGCLYKPGMNVCKSCVNKSEV